MFFSTVWVRLLRRFFTAVRTVPTIFVVCTRKKDGLTRFKRNRYLRSSGTNLFSTLWCGGFFLFFFNIFQPVIPYDVYVRREIKLTFESLYYHATLRPIPRHVIRNAMVIALGRRRAHATVYVSRMKNQFPQVSLFHMIPHMVTVNYIRTYAIICVQYLSIGCIGTTQLSSC